MPAHDLYHETVRNALIKDGWKITDAPYIIKLQTKGALYVDLGAEKIFAAEKDATKIAVEVKSFNTPSVITEFHHAVGQYQSYRIMMAKRDTDRQLFLAIPDHLMDWFLAKELPVTVIQELNISVFFYNKETEEITQWIP
jgi:XisH protein